jgi:HK97 gp10 family phage protein
MIEKNEFPRIIRQLSPRVEAALRTGAETIERGAKARVAVDSGDLRNAIHTEKDPEGYRVVAGDSKIFYGHLVEYGTSRTPAKPFLIPAMEQGRAVVVAAVAKAVGGASAAGSSGGSRRGPSKATLKMIEQTEGLKAGTHYVDSAGRVRRQGR